MMDYDQRQSYWCEELKNHVREMIDSRGELSMSKHDAKEFFARVLPGESEVEISPSQMRFMIDDDEMLSCMRCDGEGRIRLGREKSNNPDFVDNTRKCPECGGGGTAGPYSFRITVDFPTAPPEGSILNEEFDFS